MAIIRVISIVLLLLAMSFGSGMGCAEDTDMLKLMKKAMAAWNSHDPEQLVNMMADEFIYYDAAAGGNMTTREELREFYQGFVTFSPDYTWTLIGRPIVSHDSVAFDWHFGGTNTGPWGETPPTGKKYVIYGASLIRFKHGKIVFQGDYWDQLTFQKQLGLIE